MVGLAYDLLANPQGAVRSTFEKVVASSGLDFDPASLDGKDWGALDLFRQFLFDQTHLSQVYFYFLLFFFWFVKVLRLTKTKRLFKFIFNVCGK